MLEPAQQIYQQHFFSFCKAEQNSVFMSQVGHTLYIAKNMKYIVYDYTCVTLKHYFPVQAGGWEGFNGFYWLDHSGPQSFVFFLCRGMFHY